MSLLKNINNTKSNTYTPPEENEMLERLLKNDKKRVSKNIDYNDKIMKYVSWQCIKIIAGSVVNSRAVTRFNLLLTWQG